MRAIIKKNLPHILPGFDYIISARSGIKNKSYQEIEKEMEKLFKKAQLYVGE